MYYARSPRIRYSRKLIPGSPRQADNAELVVRLGNANGRFAGSDPAGRGSGAECSRGRRKYSQSSDILFHRFSFTTESKEYPGRQVPFLDLSRRCSQEFHAIKFFGT